MPATDSSVVDSFSRPVRYRLRAPFTSDCRRFSMDWYSPMSSK